MKNIALHIFFLLLTLTVAAQQNNVPAQAKQKFNQTEKSAEQVTDTKKQQAEQLNQTTQSTFSTKRYSVQGEQRLSSFKRDPSKGKFSNLNAKKQNYISPFRPNAAGDRFKSSLSGDWQFQQDANGNNLESLKEKGTTIFTDDVGYQKMKNQKFEPKNISGSDLKGDAASKLKDASKNPDTGLDAVKSSSKKLLTVDKPTMFGAEPENPEGSTQQYSEKLKKQMKDSLVGEKVMKAWDALEPLAKKNASEQDYLDALNGAKPSNAFDKGVADASAQGQQMNGLNDQIDARDLSALRLPDSILSDLEPLRHYRVPDKYAGLVDSLRDINLNKNELVMDEKKLSEEAKAAIVKKKPRPFDKFYGEAIVGYLKDGKATLFQASPSLGYHFTDNLSLGMGPNILGRVEEKKLTVTVGFRSFMKLEMLKHRAYLQVEDNVNPTAAKTEVLLRSPHNILTGGGVVLPISKKIGLNACVLYRINNHDTDPSSPWVVRLGISSLKLK